MEQQLKNLVWVTIGKTEHQAWLLEDVKGKNIVTIRWETTGTEQRVPVLSIRHEAPDDGRRSRRIRMPIQDPYVPEALNDTTTQTSSRKRKTRKSIHKARTKIKTEIKQTEESEGEQIGEAKIESSKFDLDPSKMTDLRRDGALNGMTKKGKNQGKVDEGINNIRKAQLSPEAKAKASSFSEVWENAKESALSTYADQSSPAPCKSVKAGFSTPNDPKSPEIPESVGSEGYLI